MVSLVLRTSGDPPAPIKPETRRKVLDAVKQLGYRPNRLARGLQGKCHGALGVLVRELSNLPQPLMKALLTRARQRSMTLAFEDILAENEPLTLLEEDCVDGLVLFQDMPEHIKAKIDRLPLPVVWFNTNELTRPGAIFYDEQNGVELAVAAMHRRGRGHIGSAANTKGNQQHYCLLERKVGLRAALARRGLPRPIYTEWDFPDPSACGEQIVALFSELFKAHAQLDGFLLMGDSLAPALYETARRQKRKIGRDLSVVSFNNTETARAVWPPLTSLCIDAEQSARCILETFFDLLEGEQPAPKKLPYQLISRPSL